jgi:RNA polymerase sigma factor (sigma-70 family)
LTGKAAEMDGAPGFRVFYDRHRDAIFAYLLASAANREEALDLLQDTFIRAWGRLDEVEAMGANEQRAWLRAVARNATVDQYRRRSVRRAVPLEGMAEPPAAGPGPEEATDARASLAAACDAVAALPGSLREPLLLSTVGGLTSADVGATLGIPAGTVRYRVAKARLKLTNLLAANGQGGCDDQSSR